MKHRSEKPRGAIFRDFNWGFPIAAGVEPSAEASGNPVKVVHDNDRCCRDLQHRKIETGASRMFFRCRWVSRCEDKAVKSHPELSGDMLVLTGRSRLSRLRVEK